jgi:hypothetical protein
MEFRNSTALDGDFLNRTFLRHTAPYRHDQLRVSVRYSRGADFSGTCYYREARIFVNLGRHVKFPYLMGTHVAKARSDRTRWWRETYRLSLADGYQLALFVYLHELYHHLVKAAGHSPRRKESRCDRFAARALVDHYGCQMFDSRGEPVPRERWDFQDVQAFVAKAPKAAAPLSVEPVPAVLRVPPRVREIPVTVHGVGTKLKAGRTLFDM